MPLATQLNGSSTAFTLILSLTFIQQFALRITLSGFGFIPKNYLQLLDYIEKRLLVHKIGKQFRFTHESLKEYFAKVKL